MGFGFTGASSGIGRRSPIELAKKGSKLDNFQARKKT